MNPTTNSPTAQTVRLRLAVRGVVQGVGFRPFIYRLANELALTGWVNNSPQGVWIEVEGDRSRLEEFQTRLAAEKPPRSSIHSCEATWLDAAGHDGFVIRASDTCGAKAALVLPDIATCPDCLREMRDPQNRRYRYPFTNCTNCGPRFSIILALPYDRANTSMRGFTMCAACQAEYDDPSDRRFHAQPNACPVCGPKLELWPGAAQGAEGERPRRLAHGNDALLAAAHVIRCGQIVAVKGIGGFHLFVDARNEAAVKRLRELKHRAEKPLALLCPTLASVQEICEVTQLEARLLQSPEAPIVLLRRRGQPQAIIASTVAPGNPNLGVMLPANPLHHLLLADLGFPVVATSGNLSDEPICTDELEALQRLGGIADVLLVHNRPIVRHGDDSIARVILDREMILRRARGYAPLPVSVRQSGGEWWSEKSVLAVGAQLKNTVALAIGDQVFLSQHIGDLDTEPAHQAFRRVCLELPKLYELTPGIVAVDQHPDYLSTQFARQLERGDCSCVPVQHHIAHVLACLAENEVAAPALGVAWDGTGLGEDGNIWGGEFFSVTDTAVQRVAHWRPFRLPGGDAAIQQPRRAAAGLLYELFGDAIFLRADLPSLQAFSHAELAALQTMLTRTINTPWCCSVGRLFDVVASLLGVRQKMQFEGQAALELEFAIAGVETDGCYGIGLSTETTPVQLDWAQLIEGIIADAAHGMPVGHIAAKFHNTLAEALVLVANLVGCERVALSGGCFQNKYLLERGVRRLRAAGFQPYWPQRVPTNDGGIALGQVVAARREMSMGRTPPPAAASLHRLSSIA